LLLRSSLGCERGPPSNSGRLAIGAVTAFIASYGARAIRNSSEWIWKIPMTPPVRRWMQGGDRSWISRIPLHAAIAAQVFAVASWAALGLSG
jgi:hypothetical protein